MTYLTNVEAAELLGITRQTLHKWRKQGRVPEPDMSIGRSPAWLKESLEAVRRSALAEVAKERDHKAATTMPLPEIAPQNLGFLPAARFGGAK